MAAKGDWRDIAQASGVPYETVRKIATGYTQNPGVQHMDRLRHYFRQRERAA